MAWFRRETVERTAVEPTAEVGFNSIDPAISAFWAGLGSPGTGSGERLGAASRCLQLVSQQIGAMPLRQRGPSYQPAWLSNPDPAYGNGIGDAIAAGIWSYYGQGDAFLWVTSRYADGWPATWAPLDAVTMTVGVSSETGLRTYRSNGADLNPADVLQISRNPRPGALRGTGALEAWWANVASLWATEVYAANVVAHSGVPPYALKFPGRLTGEQATALQAQWVEAVASRMGAPAVLSGGLELERLTFSPRDMLLLELREYDSKQIAAAFGVPAFLLNLPQAGGLNYSNPIQLFELWWRSELMPTSIRWQTALSRWLPRGNWVEFDSSQLLRPDLASLATVWLQLLGSDVVTTDEVRAAVLDLPPLSEGEALEQIDVPAGAHENTGTSMEVPT